MRVNTIARLASCNPCPSASHSAATWSGKASFTFSESMAPQATTAYAWSSPIEGSDKRRFFAVLHVPPVTSPVDAVRVAIVAENKR